MEERLQCLSSGKVRYTHRYNNMLFLFALLFIVIPIFSLDLNIIYRYQSHSRRHLIWTKFVFIMNRKKQLWLPANNCKIPHTKKCKQKNVSIFFFLLYYFSKSDDIVRPKITLQSCLEALVRPEEVQNFYSTAISGKTTQTLKYVLQY